MWSSTTKTYNPLGDRIPAFPASPGWTTEQIGQYARLRRRLVRLSAAVITHPWWSSVPTGEQVVAAWRSSGWKRRRRAGHCG
ncbi:hypothetical protein [Streptomyces lunaelactis]|uniref:hypothetical protein n=1 Tax=Streptomyces lunaelactis TaxID=1535768 RepID=UPI0015854774|nr:hypothetical protein [Streptomyces lunaelactis]NUK87052.1 hypothetical protein [Streptomyces lunaelactis]